jgi:hypothetical protein
MKFFSKWQEYFATSEGSYRKAHRGHREKLLNPVKKLVLFLLPSVFSVISVAKAFPACPG